MRLSLSIIAQSMQDFHPEQEIINDTRTIQYIQWIDEAVLSSNDPNVLTICPPPPSMASDGVLCIHQKNFLFFRTQSSHLIFNRILQIQNYYNQWEKRLLDSLTRNNQISWQKVTDLLEEVFNQPMLLFNLCGDLVGVTRKYEDIHITPGWRSVIKKKCVTVDLCDYVAGNGSYILPTIVKTTPPFVNYLQFNLFKDGAANYTLYINEWNRKLGTADLHLAEAVQSISQVSGYQETTEQLPTTMLFGNLLQGLLPDNAQLYQIRQQMGWLQVQHFQIALLQNERKDMQKSVWMTKRLKENYSDTIFFYRNGFIILIFPASIWSFFQQRMNATVTTYKCRCSVSTPFQDWRELPSRYEQAKAVLDNCPERAPSLLTAKEQLTDVALKACYRYCKTSALLSPAYIFLKKYDEERNTNLLDTLYFFFQQNCSTSKTADLLGIHRNTLLNRLDNIKDICDIDLNNWNERLLFLLSYGAEHLLSGKTVLPPQN